MCAGTTSLQGALKAVKTQEKAAAKPPSYADLVAGQLSVTTDQLKSAMQSARTSTHGKQDFVAALAQQLGQPRDTVAAALAASRFAGGGCDGMHGTR